MSMRAPEVTYKTEPMYEYGLYYGEHLAMCEIEPAKDRVREWVVDLSLKMGPKRLLKSIQELDAPARAVIACGQLIKLVHRWDFRMPTIQQVFAYDLQLIESPTIKNGAVLNIIKKEEPVKCQSSNNDGYLYEQITHTYTAGIFVKGK